MRPHWNRAAVSFAAAFPQVANQFFARIELRFRRLVAVEITDEADSQRNVVQKITVNVTAINLTPPSIAHLDLTIPARSAISDYKVIGEPILHAADTTMVIIEHARVTLSRAAIMHDDELPPIVGHWGAPDFFNHGTR